MSPVSPAGGCAINVSPYFAIAIVLPSKPRFTSFKEEECFSSCNRHWPSPNLAFHYISGHPGTLPVDRANAPIVRPLINLRIDNWSHAQAVKSKQAFYALRQVARHILSRCPTINRLWASDITRGGGAELWNDDHFLLYTGRYYDSLNWND